MFIKKKLMSRESSCSVQNAKQKINKNKVANKSCFQKLLFEIKANRKPPADISINSKLSNF